MQGKAPDELRARYRAAHDAGLAALQADVAAAADGIADGEAWGQLLQALEPVEVRWRARACVVTVSACGAAARGCALLGLCGRTHTRLAATRRLTQHTPRWLQTVV
jgi:hypothetical protein